MIEDNVYDGLEKFHGLMKQEKREERKGYGEEREGYGEEWKGCDHEEWEGCDYEDEGEERLNECTNVLDYGNNQSHPRPPLWS